MKETRPPSAARTTLLAVLALLVLFAQSPGGVRAGDPLPAAQGGIGWSGTITMRVTYDLRSESSGSRSVYHRSVSTTYTVNDLPHVQVDSDDWDRWEAQGAVTFTSQMESSTSKRSPGQAYDETVAGGGGGQTYLSLTCNKKQLGIQIGPTDIVDPKTHENVHVGDVYKATYHSVSWDADRTPQWIEHTGQRDERPNDTGGTFHTLQPSGFKTTSLSGSRTVSDGSQTTAISWNLSRVGLEVVITPPKELPKWVPKGTRSGMAGSTLTFKGEVRQKGGGGGSGDKDSKVTLSIQLQSSALFGICGNYPPIRGKNVGGPDLKIQVAGTSKQFKEFKEEPITSGDFSYRITAKGEFAVGDKFTLVVDCYDYGAFGLLSADSPVLVRIEGAPEPVVDLPADENKNHIADFWEQDNVGPVGTSASSDDDLIPMGAGPGDGLTLFEEYRGFMVKGGHVRTKPSIKDLFVYSDAPGITDRGVELFGKATGIKIRKIQLSEMEKDQVVNFQNPPDHIVDEKAVSIHVGTQKDIDDAWGSGGSFEHADGLTFPSQKKILLLSSTDSATIAHEMGHVVWIEHHGDGDYDLSMKGCAGSTPLCDRKRTARAVLGPVAASQHMRLDDVFIAVQRGEHSGPVTCFMRYNCADFIEIAPGHFIDYGPYDPDGSMFCNDRRGTKCGDAARGECLKQIRVSDKGN